MPYPAKLHPGTILSAARQLLEDGGPEALSMRPLAERLGVQPSSLYRHYADRAALLSALETEATLELLATVQAHAAQATPAASLHAVGLAYLAYARQHPHLYGLLLAPKEPYMATPGPGKDLWNAVLALVDAVTGQPDDTAATVAVWAYLHGFVVLERSGQFGLSGPRGGFERGLQALIEGLGRKGGDAGPG
ncbi:TetR/AcrR family transcriptional regulator [Deinococcus sonorensis]|uniref:TetR/AcrR family transcriptional regulator n=2 Tax=Deinococcus sonorensis TaxID=309891 RepID=A0AAU7UF14_9DEIO